LRTPQFVLKFNGANIIKVFRSNLCVENKLSLSEEKRLKLLIFIQRVFDIQAILNLEPDKLCKDLEDSNFNDFNLSKWMLFLNAGGEFGIISLHVALLRFLVKNMHIRDYQESITQSFIYKSLGVTLLSLDMFPVVSSSVHEDLKSLLQVVLDFCMKQSKLAFYGLLVRNLTGLLALLPESDLRNIIVSAVNEQSYLGLALQSYLFEEQLAVPSNFYLSAVRRRVAKYILSPNLKCYVLTDNQYYKYTNISNILRRKEIFKVCANCCSKFSVNFLTNNMCFNGLYAYINVGDEIIKLKMKMLPFSVKKKYNKNLLISESPIPFEYKKSILQLFSGRQNLSEKEECFGKFYITLYGVALVKFSD
jgi:hypothetical protein